MAIGRLNAYTTILQANPNLNVSELNEKITRINSLINARKAQLKEYEANLPKTREEQFQKFVNPNRVQGIPYSNIKAENRESRRPQPASSIDRWNLLNNLEF